jgi:chaperonin GroES
MAKISFKPLGGRVLIEPLEQEEVTAGGIVLPETAKEKPQQGKVLAAGPGERDDKGERIPLDVKVGDTVLFAKYSGTEVKMDGKKLLILRETDLLGIVG